MRKTRTTNREAVENNRQRRSRFAQANVPRRVRLGFWLVSALQENRFQHPAAFSGCIETDSRSISPDTAARAYIREAATDRFSTPPIGYKLLNAECAALIVSSISRVE